MIKGLDKFRKHFSDFSEHYVLIGGAASFMVMEDVGVDFRTTKDLDIVLCVEALDASFAEAFWAFVKAGGYQNQRRSSDKKIFYRLLNQQMRPIPLCWSCFHVRLICWCWVMIVI